MNNLLKSINLNKIQLPSEWIQMFRILLSIYLVWIVLLATKKPVFNDNLTTRIIFIILLVLLSQSDIISGILLLLIYFFSFQAILPMINVNESFLTDPTEEPRKIDKIMDANLKKGYELPKEPLQEVIKGDISSMLALGDKTIDKL
jgi:hypothetical protein